MASKSTEQFSWLVIPKTLWLFLQPFKWRFIFANLLLFLVFFYELAPALFLAGIVNFLTAYHTGDSLNTLYILCGVFGATWVIAAVVRLMSKAAINNMGVRMKTAARIQGFDRLLEYSLQWHMKEMTGSKVQRIFAGSDAIKGLLWNTVQNYFSVTTAIVGVLVTFLFINAWYALFLIAYTVIFLLIEFAFNRKYEMLSGRLNRLREKASGVYMEQASNMLTVKAQGAQKGVAKRLSGTEEEVLQLEIALNKLGSGKWIAFQFWNGLALSTFLLLAGLDVVRSTLSVGMIVVYFTYFEKLRKAASDTTDMFTQLIEYKTQLGRFMELFGDTVSGGHREFPTSWQKLGMDHVFFSYDQDQVGVRDLSLEIKKGSTVGVVGASGGGKSTFVKLLLGLITPQKGALTIDATPLKEISHDSLMAHIAVVLQETELFHLSLRDNITMMRDITDEQLTEIIGRTSLADVVGKLPQGLDTIIGEKGYFLSGGERQRVGIARALCKDAPIILLDEATSALDNKTEQAVLEGVFAAAKGKTIIMVAHRLSTLRFVERILVFSKGALVEDGSREALEQDTNSLYASLAAAGEKQT